MPTLCRDYLTATLAAGEAPCVSIYQPTHRRHPENAQDPIRFRNLLTRVEASLNKAYSVREVRALLEPLQRLHGDDAFWNHTLDGLAVLASPSRFDVFRFPRTVHELVVVATTFHVKPLLRYVQSADRFHVLAVAEDKLALFEGNRYALDAIPVPKVSGARAPAPSDPTAEVVVGAGIAGYFRAVDQTVTDEVSNPSGLPLILAALPENLGQFRAVARNPHLIAESIVGDPFAIDVDALRSRAWGVMAPHYLARLAKLREEFDAAVSHQRGTGDLSDAARAAVAGRIGTLLIDADQVQPGAIDATTGAISTADIVDPKVDDKLDDLAQLVLGTGGEVIVVPGDSMPTKSGLAAIYRY